MTYSLLSSSSSSPSTLLSRDTYSFFNSLHLAAPFPPVIKLVRDLNFKKISLQINQVSLQDPITEQTHNPDDKKTANLSKTTIWVNPKNPGASKLRQKSYDFRNSSLISIAESLNLCEPIEADVSNVLATSLGDNIVEQDGVVIINHMSNPDTAVVVLDYILKRGKLKKEVVLYNVTMKVFRKSKDLGRAEKLFDVMLERGVKPDNVTFSTIISCARLCSLPNKAVEWFEKMASFDCQPDEVTYSVMIDAYGRAGDVDMALKLYDRARTENWHIDAVTFATVIKIYGASGNFDGCLNVYEEMKALGVKPNMFLYNNLLDAMGRAKRPWQAKTIHKEMISNGFTPSWATYAALIRAYGRARYGEDAITVYREMKRKGMELTGVLYNTLLAMCADTGFIDAAAEIFEDMKRSEKCNPDSWTFSSLVTIYSCCGKVSEAEAALNEMLEAGFQPNLFVLTSLIQLYGKANLTDEVVKTFNRLIELDIAPDERFCGCLLNVMTQTAKEELSKLIVCIEKANPKLGYVVKLLAEGEGSNGEDFKTHAAELLGAAGNDVRKAYCNCLIDLCVNLDFLEKACELLDLGLSIGIYTDIQLKSSTQWSLHVKSLSLGAALTALHVWINDLARTIECGEELPSLLGINTGHGKHKYSDKGLAGVFEEHLKELDAPFHEDPEKVGWFLTTKVAAKTWLKSRNSQQPVAV